MSNETKLEMKNWESYCLEERIDKIADFLSFHGFLIGSLDDDQKRQDSKREVSNREILESLEHQLHLIVNMEKKLTEVITWVKKLHGYKTK